MKSLSKVKDVTHQHKNKRRYKITQCKTQSKGIIDDSKGTRYGLDLKPIKIFSPATSAGEGLLDNNNRHYKSSYDVFY